MGTFNVGFDIANYGDILPDLDEYLENDFIFNADKGDLNECVWNVAELEAMPLDRKTEVKRCLDTGFWIILKGMLVWLPPKYYMFLTRFKTGGARPNFRINRLMDIYDKIRTRKNPYAIGDFTVKSRQIGETTIEMSNCLFEAAKMDYGLIGIQSMTRKVVQQSCWRTLLMGWDGMDKWLKDEIFSEFSSGDFVAESMKFVKPADDYDGGKNVQIMYTAGTFDSVNNMRIAVLDEWLKWEEQSPYGTFLNYEKFILNGTTRKGLFSIISSPPDKATKYSAETYQFWKDSDPKDLDANGTTKTGVFRHFTSPLTGIEGFYDKWGDADANPIYDWIMKRRKSRPKDHLMGEIRAYPLNESEIFESTDANAMQWQNRGGIESRKIYLMGTKFKNEQKEPIRVYGNLEWKDGIVDSDVEFRQADVETFDEFVARFSFSYLPQYKEELKRNVVYVNGLNIGLRPSPSKYVENCLGIDPYSKRYRTGDNNSKGAMVNHKFRDIFDTGIVRCPTMIYAIRPSHADIFHEDAIKAAIFNRAMVQPESITDKIIDYFEDRGYFDWMLPKIGHKRNSLQKGDAPTGGKNLLMGEIIGLIDAITNTPIMKGGDYPLLRNWFYELLEDVSQFDRADTHKFDLMMAWGQALLGSAKLLYQKVREPNEMNDTVFDFMFG